MDREILGGCLTLVAGAALIAAGLLLGSHHHATSGLALDALGALTLIAGVAVLRISVGLPKSSPPLFRGRLRGRRDDELDDAE